MGIVFLGSIRAVPTVTTPQMPIITIRQNKQFSLGGYSTDTIDPCGVRAAGVKSTHKPTQVVQLDGHAKCMACQAWPLGLKQILLYCSDQFVYPDHLGWDRYRDKREWQSGWGKGLQQSVAVFMEQSRELQSGYEGRQSFSNFNQAMKNAFSVSEAACAFEQKTDLNTATAR